MCVYIYMYITCCVYTIRIHINILKFYQIKLHCTIYTSCHCHSSMKSHIEIFNHFLGRLFTNSHWHRGKYLGLADLPPQHDRSESPRDFSPFSLWDRTTSRRPACYVCVARYPRSSVYPWWSWALFVRDFHRLGWWETTFHSVHSCHLSQHLRRASMIDQLQHIEVRGRKWKPSQCKISLRLVQSCASLQLVRCLNSQTSDWCQTVLRSRELHGRLPHSLLWFLHDFSMFLASWNHHPFYLCRSYMLYVLETQTNVGKFGSVSWSWKNPSRTKSRKRRTPWGDDSGSIWIWISPLVVSHLTRHCRCHFTRSLDSFVSSRRTKPLSLRDMETTMASCFTLAAPVPPHKRNKCNSNAKMKTLWAMTTAEPEKHLSRLRLWRNKSSGKNSKLKWSLLMNFQILNVSGYELLWLFDMTWFDILRYSVEASWFPSRVPLGVLPTRREDDHRLSKIHA